jgi:hypothetical protein
MRTNEKDTKKTRYIAAYDTEDFKCIAACKVITEVHKKLDVPATFFVVGKLLEENYKELKPLLNNPLFEIASHTYSHRALRDNIFCGPEISAEDKIFEINRSKQIIEDIMERPCLGLRPAFGFDEGFRGKPDTLRMIREAGYCYTSSLLWGPDFSLPALLNDPFTYETDGFPGLWELPSHGWHENLLKDNNEWGPRRITLWPSPIPEAIPLAFLKTPEDEFNVNRVFIEKALNQGTAFSSFVWHPWSLHKFNPDMEMLELTFAHVKKLGLKFSTYADLYHACSNR